MSNSTDMIRSGGGYSSINLRRIYREGFRARKEGRPLLPNPYDDTRYHSEYDQNKLHDVWAHGWNDADDEQQEGGRP